jgi:uncharacterized protein YegP (UPF0339 family)
MALDNYKSLDFYQSRSDNKGNGFSTFEEGGAYFFTYSIDGKVYLISEDYSTEKGRDNGVESVKKNMKNKDRMIAKSESGKHFFSLRAGNNQEIARSRYFDSAAGATAGIGAILTGKSSLSSLGGSSKKVENKKKDNYKKKDDYKKKDNSKKNITGAAAAGATGLAASSSSKSKSYKKETVATGAAAGKSSYAKKTEKTEYKESGGGFKWWWLLPLLLLLALGLFFLKGCDGCGAAGAVKDKTEKAASTVKETVKDAGALAAEKAASAKAEAERLAKVAADKAEATRIAAAEEAARVKKEASRSVNDYVGNKASGY